MALAARKAEAGGVRVAFAALIAVLVAFALGGLSVAIAVAAFVFFSILGLALLSLLDRMSPPDDVG
jgi:hypothetical protein